MEQIEFPDDNIDELLAECVNMLEEYIDSQGFNSDWPELNALEIYNELQTIDSGYENVPTTNANDFYFVSISENVPTTSENVSMINANDFHTISIGKNVQMSSENNCLITNSTEMINSSINNQEEQPKPLQVTGHYKTPKNISSQSLLTKDENPSSTDTADSNSDSPSGSDCSDAQLIKGKATYNENQSDSPASATPTEASTLIETSTSTPMETETTNNSDNEDEEELNETDTIWNGHTPRPRIIMIVQKYLAKQQGQSKRRLQDLFQGCTRKDFRTIH